MMEREIVGILERWLPEHERMFYRGAAKELRSKLMPSPKEQRDLKELAKITHADLQAQAQAQQRLFLVVEIGCIECSDETTVLGVYKSVASALEKHPNATLSKSPTVIEYGRSTVIFELPHAK